MHSSFFKCVRITLTGVNLSAFQYVMQQHMEQYRSTLSYHACQSNFNKKKKKTSTLLFGLSPWDLVAMYVVSQ